MQYFSDVHTPDFATQMLQNEKFIKSLKYSKKGISVSTTSAPASLFNSPETLRSPFNESLAACEELMPYTQQLEETIIPKYSALKEVFNNLSQAFP